MFQRVIQKKLENTLKRGKSILLLGPRQTGKTTIIRQLPHDEYLNLMDNDLRQKYERSPSSLIQEIKARGEKKPVVIIDEIQRCPELLDSVQILIDEGHAQFILTGSSARKLRQQANVNLLPGRVVSFAMTPLLLSEYDSQNCELERILENGMLPGILNIPNSVDQDEDLRSYASTYLEEEIRSEALVRDLAPFSHFLQLTSSESGSITNFTALAKDIGVSPTTIKEYYQILDDCLLAYRIEPLITSSTRRRLIKSPRYLIFDMGVRRACAREPSPLPEKNHGHLLEHFVGLSIRYWQQNFAPNQRLFFWRDSNGPEVDWVVENNRKLHPIEVKWTAKPSSSDARHLELFSSEYDNAEAGVVVCRVDRPIMLTETVKAIPWQMLEEHLASLIKI